jgi:hypothetical protein
LLSISGQSKGNLNEIFDVFFHVLSPNLVINVFLLECFCQHLSFNKSQIYKKNHLIALQDSLILPKEKLLPELSKMLTLFNKMAQ